MLEAIKITHTFLWFVLACCTIYILYCGIKKIWNWKLYAALILILGESLTLFLTNFKCPLAMIAERYTNNPYPGFDIYLPEWFLPYNMPVFGAAIFIGLAYNIRNWIRRLKIK